MTISVGVFGLGLMGRPIARTLLAKGFAVRGWNRSRLDPSLTRAIPLSASLEEAAGAEICLLMLADSDAVDAVLSSLDPFLRAGQTIIDMGSSDPSRSKEHAALLLTRQIAWVDAPVSGGPEGAASGTLAIMAGAAEAHLARARPVLEALGSVVHVGGPGAGHLVKVLNQVIVGLTIEAVAEALILAERSGIDPRLVQQALRGGFADSRVLQIHGTRMIRRTYDPGGKVRTQLKDLRLALDLAAGAGVELPHTRSAAAHYQRLVDQGDGNLDHSALHKLLAAP